MEKKMDYTKIPKEQFAFYQRDENIHDKKLDTKPVGYFRDAMGRFARNKSSVAAAVIIALLILYAVIIPYAGGNKYTNSPIHIPLPPRRAPFSVSVFRVVKKKRLFRR